MVAPRTPNYVIDQEFTYSWDSHDRKSLPAGSFVRPIQLCYIPKHITESKKHENFDPETQVYCSTRYGIIAIPKHLIREV